MPIARPALYLVPTPIGNLADITVRSIEVLKAVDVIYAEDTRTAKVLLSQYNATAPLKSYHLFNEATKVAELLADLAAGKACALITDAGTPAISDPGYLAVRAALAEKFPVVALPGPCAAITALVGSGLANHRFYFYGFLDSRAARRRKQLAALAAFPETLVFYEAPHRIMDMLTDLYAEFGEREVVLARELSKQHEEYIRGSLSTVLAAGFTAKGEFTVVVSGAPERVAVPNAGPAERYAYYIAQGYSDRDALKAAAKDLGVAKNVIYQAVKTK